MDELCSGDLLLFDLLNVQGDLNAAGGDGNDLVPVEEPTLHAREELQKSGSSGAETNEKAISPRLVSFLLMLLLPFA